MRETIISVLERYDAACADVRVEREMLAQEIAAALLMRPDAVLIRTEMQHASTGGRAIVVMRGIGGAREAEVLEAAIRMARGH